MKCLWMLVEADSHGSYVGRWIEMDSNSYPKHMHQEKRATVAVSPWIFYVTNITNYKHVCTCITKQHSSINWCYTVTTLKYCRCASSSWTEIMLQSQCTDGNTEYTYTATWRILFCGMWCHVFNTNLLPFEMNVLRQSSVIAPAIKMERACSSATSLNFYQTAQQHTRRQ
jgi:hypothetical protein